MGKEPRCWIVTDGALGHVKQCAALARHLNVEAETFEVVLRQPWDLLAPYWHVGGLRAIRGSLADRLRGPLPDLLLTAGRRAVLAALTIKRLSGGRTFTVQLMNPGISTAHFDLVVCPRHDRLRGSNVISTAGALHDIDDQTLADARDEWAAEFGSYEAPRVGLLVGGPNRAFYLGEAELEAAAECAERIAGSEASIMVTTAGRTPDALRAFLRRRVARGFVWTGEADGPNPYRGILAWADHLLVSADSVNMLSEALGTGKPVYRFPLGAGTAKFQRFLGELEGRGLQPFTKAPARVDYAPLREAPAVAAEIARRMESGAG